MQREHVVVEQQRGGFVDLAVMLDHPRVVPEQFGPQGQGEDASEEEEDADDHHVHHADPLVIEREEPRHDALVVGEVVIFRWRQIEHCL